MKHQVHIHFCLDCLRDFKSLSDSPEFCSKCGSPDWYHEAKPHRPTERPSLEAYEE